MPAATPYTQATATAELIDELGPPLLMGGFGVQLRVWVLCEEGDGILFSRLSGRDLRGGETAMGQITPLRELAERRSLRPRLIVHSGNNSGARRFEHRVDFALAQRAIETDGWCRWVGWRDADRIGREDLPLALYYDLLRRYDVGLYLCDLGRAVNWEADRLELGFRTLVSIRERIEIKNRTHNALERTWVRGGRGWPGARPFGFRRNWATKHLEPDPDQWQFVKLIHLRYADLDLDRGSGGLRQLAAELKEVGCELSHNRVRRVLQDPIYVTGEHSFVYQGERVAGKPVPLTDPIPEHVFQRNNELLGLRKANTRTPLGTFCLNGVPIEHAACAHLRDARGRRPLLKGRLHMERDLYVYRHEPWVPERCYGYTIEREPFERAVLEALSDALCGSDVMLSTWALASAPTINRTLRLTGEELGRLEREIGTLERRRAQLAREFRRRLVNGEPANELAYHDLTVGIDTEIGQLRERLRMARRLQPLTTKETARSEITWSLDRLLGNANDLQVEKAAFIQAAVHRIVVNDRPDGSVRVDVQTPLI